MINVRTVLGLLTMATAAALTTTQAASYTENFDSYTAGSSIQGQGGWKGWDNAAGAAANVSSTFAESGANSINITGGSDLVRTWTGFNSGLYDFTVSQYIPSSSSGTTYFILLNQYNDGGPYNWSVQIPFNLGTGQVTDDEMTGETPLTIVKDAWVPLRISIDLTGNTVSQYYNNQLLGTHPWQTGGFNELAAIDLFANGAGPVYYDNLSITQVPEPGTLALLGLGGLALVLRRRRS